MMAWATRSDARRTLIGDSALRFPSHRCEEMGHSRPELRADGYDAHNEATGALGSIGNSAAVGWTLNVRRHFSPVSLCGTTSTGGDDVLVGREHGGWAG